YRIHVDFKRGWTVHTHETDELADPGPNALPYTSDFVFLGKRPRKPRLLMPDVEPSKPANFHIESAAGTTFYQSFDRGLRQQPSNGPPHYFVPSTCDTNDNQDPKDPVYPNAEYFRSAISPGWQDTYPWFILDSYIDISDVRDGRYLIVDRVNTSGVVQEKTRANNTSIACVEFHGTTAAACPVVRSR